MATAIESCLAIVAESLRRIRYCSNTADADGRRRVPHGAKVLFDPKVNPLALAEWGKLGVSPVLFRNGHSQIKDYMRQIGADRWCRRVGPLLPSTEA